MTVKVTNNYYFTPPVTFNKSDLKSEVMSLVANPQQECRPLVKIDLTMSAQLLRSSQNMAPGVL